MATPSQSALEQAQQIYLDKFGRAGDTEGVNYWAGRIDAGESAQSLADGAFKDSARVTTDNYLRTGQNPYSELLDQDLKGSGIIAGAIQGAQNMSAEDLARGNLKTGTADYLYGKQPQKTPIINGARTYTPATLGSPTAWTVTPDQTVEGRIDRLMDPNSPMQVQARTRAAQGMNSRGLINSALALSAGEAAGYEAAIPIAQADAATYAKAAGYNADQSNQFAVRNADARNQLTIAEMNADTQRAIAQLNADSQAQATEVQNANKVLLDTNSQASQAFNTAMSAINNIQNNNQMDGDTKTRAVANVWRDLQTQLNVLGSVAGLNLTSKLNFANYPGFDAQGRWVGFEDGPGARTAGTGPAPTPAPAGAPVSPQGTAT